MICQNIVLGILCLVSVYAAAKDEVYYNLDAAAAISFLTKGEVSVPDGQKRIARKASNQEQVFYNANPEEIRRFLTAGSDVESAPETVKRVIREVSDSDAQYELKSFNGENKFEELQNEPSDYKYQAPAGRLGLNSDNKNWYGQFEYAGYKSNSLELGGDPDTTGKYDSRPMQSEYEGSTSDTFEGISNQAQYFDTQTEQIDRSRSGSRDSLRQADRRSRQSDYDYRSQANQNDNIQIEYEKFYPNLAQGRGSASDPENENSQGYLDKAAEDELRIANIPGFISILLCGENTEEGKAECVKKCEGVVSCHSFGCFCSNEAQKEKQAVSQSRTGSIILKQLAENPKRTPIHVCGGNNFDGSQSCRNMCAEKTDIIVCVTDLCYCNLRRSTGNILENRKSDNVQTKPLRTDEIKYDPKEVLSSWDCAIGKGTGKVEAHERCIRECWAMKAHDAKGGVMLTCDPGTGKCKCISFAKLSGKMLKLALESRAHVVNVHTTRAPEGCRGYACLIEAKNEEKAPDGSLSQRPVEDFDYCGKNNEEGFAKCREACTYEVLGVIRCAGHSCYCHKGGIPFLEQFSQYNQTDPVLSNRPPYQRSGLSAIPAPFKSRFLFCGNTEEGCQDACDFIGDVVCGRLGCYCDSGL